MDMEDGAGVQMMEVSAVEAEDRKGAWEEGLAVAVTL